jgi:malate permease and related proteins
MIAGYAAARIMRLPPAQVRTLIQASFRGNIAFIGLPVVAYSIGETSRDMITLSVLMVSILLPINNIFAVLVLLRGQPRFDTGGALWAALEWIVVNPLIISCAAGLIVAAIGIQLPVALLRTVKPLGDMALPLALLSIGSMLDFREVKGLWLPILAASLIKVALTPYIGYLSAGMAGVSGDELRVVLIMLACPTATASFIMTFQMGGDTHMTAGAIVLSTILSFITLFLIIWL